MIDYIQTKIRGRIRVYLSWIFLFLSIFAIHRTPSIIGILIMAFGAALRYWASGYIDKEGRLSIAGPYTYIRNPLYVGSHLMALGLVISQGSLLLVAIYLLCFFPLYHLIIKQEEAVLKTKFGDLFQTYCSLVPRYIPSFFCLAAASKLQPLYAQQKINPLKFSFAKARQNRGMEAVYTFLGLLFFIFAVLYLRKH